MKLFFFSCFDQNLESDENDKGNDRNNESNDDDTDAGNNWFF